MADIKFRQLKYNKARRAIMKFIAESGIRVGDRLPPERELVNQLPCSMITMRHALADMESAGLIARRHGSGTYLAKEIRDDSFQCSILFVSVFHKGEDLPGRGLDRLRLYLADRGLGLSYVAVTEFGLEVVNAARDCIGVIADGWLTDDFIVQLKTLNLPVIVQGNVNLHEDVPAISLDLELAAYRLARIMIEDGRRRIALFRGPGFYYPAVQAERGYLKAMHEAGLPPWIMRVEERFTYNEEIERFMAEHADVEGILMEHPVLVDFISWIWRTGYAGRPAIGFLSRETDHKKYRQNRNFLWLKFENLSIRVAQALLDHVIEGKPMKSVKLVPVIPSVDDDSDSFIS